MSQVQQSRPPYFRQESIIKPRLSSYQDDLLAQQASVD